MIRDLNKKKSFGPKFRALRVSIPPEE